MLGGPAVKALKRFHSFAIAFVLVNIALFTTCVLLTISVFSDELWWLYWPLFGWGIGSEALILAVVGSGGGSRGRKECEIGRDDGRGDRVTKMRRATRVDGRTWTIVRGGQAATGRDLHPNLHPKVDGKSAATTYNHAVGETASKEGWRSHDRNLT